MPRVTVIANPRKRKVVRKKARRVVRKNPRSREPFPRSSTQLAFDRYEQAMADVYIGQYVVKHYPIDDTWRAEERNARRGHARRILGSYKTQEAAIKAAERADEADAEAVYHLQHPKRNPRRVKANPAAARVSCVLSTRAVELRYMHAEDKGQPYKHAFSRGVSVQLLSDGSVRLVRPDGRPLWKNFL